MLAPALEGDLALSDFAVKLKGGVLEAATKLPRRHVSDIIESTVKTADVTTAATTLIIAGREERVNASVSIIYLTSSSTSTSALNTEWWWRSHLRRESNLTSKIGVD